MWWFCVAAARTHLHATHTHTHACATRVPCSTAFDRTTEQRGVYNRAMITVRVEDVPAENVEAMHEFFMQLRDQSGRQEAKFNIVLSPM